MRRCLLLLAVWALAACGGVETVQPPRGLDVHLDQARIDRQGRQVFLRVHNPTTWPLRVEAFHLTSARFPAVDWTTGATVDAGYENDLKFQLPRSRCGADLKGRVVLTYRIGDGDLRRSALPVKDIYGTVGLAMDRDCARTRLTRAATLAVGQVSVARTKGRLTATIPVTLTPTGADTEVSFDGYESTVLFEASPRSGRPVRLMGAEKTLPLRLIPARCDAHALAEDKVGTLIGVRVKAPGLPSGTSFYLPISPAARAALHSYYADACGLR